MIPIPYSSRRQPPMQSTACELAEVDVPPPTPDVPPSAPPVPPKPDTPWPTPPEVIEPSLPGQHEPVREPVVPPPTVH